MQLQYYMQLYSPRMIAELSKNIKIIISDKLIQSINNKRFLVKADVIISEIT